MGMKMSFDMTESARQIAPAGEYRARLATGEKDYKVFGPSSKGKPMLSLKWIPFNPPPGVEMDQIDKCIISDWISFAPNALFSMKNLLWACGQELECAACGNHYAANLDLCPSCQSMMVTVDWDFLDDAQPGMLIEIGKDKNDRDVNQVKKYFPWTK